jgi:putative ABC transport system ATP-binding protein
MAVRPETTSATVDTAASPGKLIELQRLTKTYRRGQESVCVLDELDLEVAQSSFLALMGPSGSGKSTLLNLIAGLDEPSAGSVSVAGVNLGQLSDAGRADWRARNVGFVFQTFNLMPVLNALENVMLPLLLTSLPLKQRVERAQTALRVVGLADRVHHFPSQLSGGQEQRVTIARAIVTDPQIIVADEPTGDLDRTSADEILNLLQLLNRDFGKTILMVTHDPAAAERATRTLRLDKGRLVN